MYRLRYEVAPRRGKMHRPLEQLNQLQRQVLAQAGQVDRMRFRMCQLLRQIEQASPQILAAPAEMNQQRA